MSEADPATSSSELPPEPSETIEIKEEFAEPDAKKRKVSTSAAKNSDSKSANKLEQRLGGILCCAVCLDLPRSSVYQVSHFFLLSTQINTHTPSF